MQRNHSHPSGDIDVARELQGLVDRRRIHDVLLLLASAIDRNDRERMLECYHPAAIDDHGEFSGPVERFVEWVALLYRERVEAMSHQISNHRVELHGDLALAETYVQVFLAGREREGRRVQMVGAGRYLDRFERRRGEWRIAHRKVITDWQQMHTFPATSDGALVTGLHWGLASRGDPSYPHFAQR